jgi:hypothetical protein
MEAVAIDRHTSAAPARDRIGMPNPCAPEA